MLTVGSCMFWDSFQSTIEREWVNSTLFYRFCVVDDFSVFTEETGGVNIVQVNVGLFFLALIFFYSVGNRSSKTIFTWKQVWNVDEGGSSESINVNDYVEITPTFVHQKRVWSDYWISVFYMLFIMASGGFELQMSKISESVGNFENKVNNYPGVTW